MSICIPTFNRDKYLAQAIESALNQDYENIEVIVADNCSSDGTQELVRQFITDSRFSYFRNEENVGAVNNIKKLLYEKVAGRWFLILSDDDYLLDKSYISEAMNLVERHPEIKMVYANGYIEHTSTNTMKELELPFQEIADGNEVFLTMHTVKPQPFTLCNVLFDTHTAKQLRAFSNPYNYPCDAELFLKTCLLGKVGLVKKFVSVYRWHSSNVTTQKRTFEELTAMATDFLVSPQVMAKEIGIIPDADLARRERDVVIPHLKKVLLAVYAIDAKLSGHFVSMLNKEGINVSAFYSDPVFLIKIFVSRSATLYWFFRRLKKFIRDLS